MATTTNGSSLTHIADSSRKERFLPLNQWEQAAKSIGQLSATDEKYPELYEQLLDRSEPHNYFFEPYESKWKPQIIPKGGFSPYPSVISTAYEHLKKCNFQGLLPEIHHSWFTVDNKLFLWDYTKKSRVVEYDHFDQEIVSVGVMKPKQGVFRDFVHFVLVVATSVEISLFGIVFENNDHENGHLTLHPSPLKISTDNDCVRKIVGTSDGRVYFAGSQGVLNEFEYDADYSIFHQIGWSKNCRKVQHTNGFLLNAVPSFIGDILPLYKSPAAILDILVDQERQILYTLGSSSAVTVYDISGAGTKYIVDKNVCDEAVKFCSSSAARGGSRPDRRLFSNSNQIITSLAVVGRNESAYIHLIAVSNTGVRFYFSTFDTSKYSTGKHVSNLTRPSRLTMVHIRLPPPVTKPAQHQGMEGVQPGFSTEASAAKHIKRSIYSHGTLLMVDSVPEQHGRIIGVTHDLISRQRTAGTVQYRKPILRESVMSKELHGAVYDLVEYNKSEMTVVPSTTDVSDKKDGLLNSKRSHSVMSKVEEGKPVIVGELTTQFCESQRHFLVLTHMGLYVFKKLRPIDFLYQLLTERKDCQEFFEYYGTAQVCAMLFGIASGVVGVLTDEIRLQAIRYALEFGGHPSLANYGTSTATGTGRLVMTDDMYMSGHHDGLYLLVMRVLRPIWSKGVIQTTTESSKNKKTEIKSEVSFAKPILHSIRSTLFQLKQIFEQTETYRLAIQQPFVEDEAREMSTLTRALHTRAHNPQNIERTRQVKAIKAEEYSIQRLYLLVCRAIEGISLLLYSSVTKIKPSSLTFGLLISTKEGDDFATELIDVVMQYMLSSNASIDTMVDVLRRECSSFFTVSDVFKYQGQQLLIQAKQTLNTMERSRMLRNTLQQFLRSSSHWNTIESISIVDSVCRDFIQMSFFSGVVDLALACAKNFKPTDTDARQRCYQCILNAFHVLLSIETDTEPLTLPVEERRQCYEETMDHALACNDMLFHQTLYQWLIDQKKSNLVIMIQSPFIEDYLKAQDSDLLCRFYVYQKRYVDATLVMWYNAQQEVAESLDIRLDYLTKALNYAELASSSSYQLNNSTGITIDTVKEIRERLEIAQLQKRVKDRLTDEHEKETLEHEVIDVSTLYNSYVMKNNLWDLALAIMHSCQANDSSVIAQHWERIIYSHIPIHSLNPQVSNWLSEKIQESGTHEHAAGTFENSEWIGTLEHEIRSLGNQFYNTGADFVFPVSHLALLLETLWMKFHSTASRSTLPRAHWIIKLFRDIKIPYAVVFNAYNTLYHRSGSPEWQLHMLHSMSYIVSDWKHLANSPRATSHERVAFAEACPMIVNAFEEFTTDLQAMASDTGTQRKECLDAIRQLKSELLKYRQDHFA